MVTFVSTQPVSARRTAPITTPRAIVVRLMVLIALAQKAGTSHRSAESVGNACRARAEASRRRDGGRAPSSAVSGAWPSAAVMAPACRSAVRITSFVLVIMVFRYLAGRMRQEPVVTVLEAPPYPRGPGRAAPAVIDGASIRAAAASPLNHRNPRQALLQRRVRQQVDFGVRDTRARWTGVYASWSHAEGAGGQARCPGAQQDIEAFAQG